MKNTIKLEENGKYTIGFGLKFSIIGFSNGYIILDVTNTDKYAFENGHKFTAKRKLNYKTRCFKFDNNTFNIEQVAGFDTILSEI